MYIAHKCTKCRKSDIVYYINQTQLSCRVCGHIEEEKDFWQEMRSEAYLRELESEIEDCYPFKDIDLIGCKIDLAIGWHVLGRYDDRDKCIDAILQGIKELYDKWQICYSYFAKVEKRILKYEKIAETGDKEDHVKYQVNLDSMRDFFKDFPEKMKSVCK